MCLNGCRLAGPFIKVGVSAPVGTVSGNWLGEIGGELLYESEWL